MDNDKKLADAVRAAADELAGKMEAAAAAGLEMTVVVTPLGRETFGNGDTKQFHFHPHVTIWRTGHV